jgi:excisionase family DNA binding protein
MRHDALLPDSDAATAAPLSDDLHELLTVDEVAALLKVSKSWVYEHVRSSVSGRLPAVKLGKYVRFDRDDIRAYLNAKREARHPLHSRR